jgi:hypothetical protein
MLVLDLLQWGNEEIQDRDDRQPPQDDGDRKSTDRPRCE